MATESLRVVSTFKHLSSADRLTADRWHQVLKKYYEKPLKQWLNSPLPTLEKKRVSTVLTHGSISAPHSWVVGNLLFDTHAPQYLKITSVVKTEKKDGSSTLLTLDTGKKITLSSEAQVTAFVNRYESVTPQPVPRPEPTKHYARHNTFSYYNHVPARDTKLNDAALEYINDTINDTIKGAVEQALKPVKKDLGVIKDKKQRWFR